MTGPKKTAASSSAPAADGLVRVQLVGASHGKKRNAVVEVDKKKAKSLIERRLARPATE